jgi:hypothetical protein
VAQVVEQVFGDAHDAVRVVGDHFGFQVVDGVAGVLEDDEVQLVVAVEAVRQHLLKLVLARQPLRELPVIFIKHLHDLLQPHTQALPVASGALYLLRLLDACH